MLKNYLLTAYREIFKNKTFSIIHVFGLSMGIAAFVLILQYSLYELSYNEFPEVLAYARLININGIIKIMESTFREDKMYAANSTFLTILPVKLIAGVDSFALDEPYTAVISETIARKYYGDVNVTGKIFYDRIVRHQYHSIFVCIRTGRCYHALFQNIHRQGNEPEYTRDLESEK